MQSTSSPIGKREVEDFSRDDGLASIDKPPTFKIGEGTEV